MEYKNKSKIVETGDHADEQGDKVEWVLKCQLIISTLILSPMIIGAVELCLPSKYVVDSFTLRSPYHAWICCLCGLWSGLLIGYITEIMTSHSYKPVRDIS